MISSKLRPILFLTVLLFIPLAKAEPRRWQDASGQFAVLAELIEEREDAVVLRKNNGVVIEVPVLKLSDEDREYLQSLSQPPSPSEGEDPFENAPVAAPTGEKIAEVTESEGGSRPDFRSVLEQLDEQGAHGKRVIRRLQFMASLAPEWMKRPETPFLLFFTSLVLFLPAYLWLLKHEFAANPLWGVAQILADCVGACLVPFFGAFVTLIFAAGHLRDSWKPVLFYFCVSAMFLSSFVFVSKDLYEGLGVEEVAIEKVEEKEAPKDPNRSYRPGKYKAPVAPESTEGAPETPSGDPFGEALQ